MNTCKHCSETLKTDLQKEKGFCDHYCMGADYDEVFVGEVEILHFENSREALPRQAIRFDEPKHLAMSPECIKEFLISNKFDLSVEGAVIIKSFDFIGTWEDYFIELSDWLGNGQIPNDEPTHPDVVCYQTMYLRAL